MDIPLAGASGVGATPPSPGSALNRERVTVVVPTYNRRESLRRCLLGILTCRAEGLDVEVRVVDDGSTDGTREMVEEVARAATGPVRIAYHAQRNAGAGAARNRGIEASDTDLVLFIDDDCVPEPDWIRALVDAPWGPKTGAVGGQIISAEKGTWVSRYCRYTRFNEFPVGSPPLRFVNTANCAYSRRALEVTGGFDAVFTSAGGEDHDLSWRIACLGFDLEYELAAVVKHYHRESLRPFSRAFWIRGYAAMLLDVLWGLRPRPTRGQVAREAARQAATCLRILLLPVDAVRF
ncbi:MAG TPA: glycosyltransferase family 2 protein, partial [Armatimonadota bacterium]|nr:glycosyltransferase family 2 protein [Armatimonadota bacterium]